MVILDAWCIVGSARQIAVASPAVAMALKVMSKYFVITDLENYHRDFFSSSHLYARCETE